jgi:hypothetical protein
MELGIQDEETREGGITNGSKLGEEIRGMLVDEKRSRLEEDLKNAIDDGKDEIKYRNP